MSSHKRISILKQLVNWAKFLFQKCVSN